MLRRVWRGWKQALILVQPETVVRRYRAVFKLYWTWFSRHQAPAGRKRIDLKLRELICRMVAENPRWSAPRIQGELAMLGFDISGRTVLRWMRKAPGVPNPQSGCIGDRENIVRRPLDGDGQPCYYSPNSLIWVLPTSMAETFCIKRVALPAPTLSLIVPLGTNTPASVKSRIGSFGSVALSWSL